MKKIALLLALIASSLYCQEKWTSLVPPRQTMVAASRAAYEQKAQGTIPAAGQSCIFCPKLALDSDQLAALDDDNPDKWFVVQRFDNGTVVALNQMPYSRGHVLLTPQEHLENFTDIRGKALSEWAIVRNWAGAVLQKIYQSRGFNNGVNFGELGGQSVPHIHEHVIPRFREGFMGPVADTYVISETLKMTHEKVVPAFARLNELLHDGEADKLTLEKIFDIDNN